MLSDKIEELLDITYEIESFEESKEALEKLYKNLIYLVMIAEDIQYEIRTRQWDQLKINTILV